MIEKLFFPTSMRAPYYGGTLFRLFLDKQLMMKNIQFEFFLKG
jgi:hypothetical protein